MTVLELIALLAVAFMLALYCRSGHEQLAQLRKWYYAHRGLHGNGIPENSMAAFRLALEKGYGIELDVHLMKDGNLAVIHDSALARTTGAEGKIEDLTQEELKNYFLEGTQETIPTFREVLELFGGKAPLIVELKAEGGNHAALAEAACKMLDAYDGLYCIESFDPRCIRWVRENRPQVVRGQLAEDFLKEQDSDLSWLTRFALTNLLMNFLTRPDFVAYRFSDRNGIAPSLCRGIWRAQGVSWTLRTKEEFDIAVAEGNIPIFEGFEP